MVKSRNYTLTKKIAKHGNQAIILVPKILENELKPETIVKLNIEIVKEKDKNDRSIGKNR